MTSPILFTAYECAQTLSIKYGCGEEVSGILLGLNHLNTSLIHSHIAPPDTITQVNLEGIHSVRKQQPYAYSHMNVLKHFLDIQYGCGEEVSGILQPQPCQHIIISSHCHQNKQISGSTWPARL